METPTLTKKDQRKSLSSKKGKKETLKNLITTPFVNYWPLLKEDDLDIVKDVLNTHLMLIKPPKVRIPWKEIESITREDRKSFRLIYNKDKESLTEAKDNRDGIVFGVNGVTRLLEKDLLASVLIANDVKPHLMVRHVIDMAVVNSIPVLIVPDLREILKSKTGISSITVGFKKSINRDSSYFHIHEKVKNVYTSYPVPERQINCHRQKLFDCENVDIAAKKLDLNLNLSSQNEIKDVKESCKKRNEGCKMEMEDVKEEKPCLYLYRTSKKVRVFVPSNNNDLPIKRKADSLDFINLESESVWKTKKSSEERLEAKQVGRNVSYKPLIVKRVKSNKNRLQRKIQILKSKK